MCSLFPNILKTQQCILINLCRNIDINKYGLGANSLRVIALCIISRFSKKNYVAIIFQTNGWNLTKLIQIRHKRRAVGGAGNSD